MEIGISKDIYKRGLSSTVARGSDLCTRDLKFYVEDLTAHSYMLGQRSQHHGALSKVACLKTVPATGMVLSMYKPWTGEGGEEPPVAWGQFRSQGEVMSSQ